MGARRSRRSHRIPTPGYSAGFDWNLPSLMPNNATTRANGFINESGLTNAQLANAQLPRLGRPELQIGTRDRVGASFAMQYRPNDKVDLTFDALFADLEGEFDRYTNNLLVRNTNAGTNNATGFGYITPRNFELDENRNVASGTLENAKFWSENRTNANETKFTSFTLGGNWQITEKIKLGAKVNHAESNWDFRMTTYLLLSDPGNVNLDINGNGIPTINPLSISPTTTTGSSTPFVCSRARATRRTTRRCWISPGVTRRRTSRPVRSSTSSTASATSTAPRSV